MATEKIQTPYDAEEQEFREWLKARDWDDDRDQLSSTQQWARAWRLGGTEGYLRAMQDVAPLRESHHNLVEILALICEEGVTTNHLNKANEALAQAEALEKGEAS